MTIHRNLPSINNLCVDPHLAILAVLDTILEMVDRALRAEHPDVFDLETPDWSRTDIPSVMAEEVISSIGSLRKALDGYWFLLIAESEPMPPMDEHFPF